MINWLMQRTTDGATYFQVTIVFVVLVAVIIAGVYTFFGIKKDIEEDKKESEKFHEED